ncbi:MAG: acetolactate decarboxylase [Salinibacter sp.]
MILDLQRPGVLLMVLLAGLLGVSCASPAPPSDATEKHQEDVVYQVATLNSLLQGNYDGTGTVGDLLRHGTLGLGTVDRLDGEMVIVEGTAYAVRDDGTTDSLGAGTGVPFGVAVPFDPDTTVTLRDVSDLSAFQSKLDQHLSATDQIYAFRVTGDFDRLQARSVSAQRPPYPDLEAVIANQTEFTFRNAAGTMVGFRIPDAFDGVTTAGYHAHFVTASRDGGGHVLDLRSSELTVQIDRASSLRVDL